MELAHTTGRLAHRTAEVALQGTASVLAGEHLPVESPGDRGALRRLLNVIAQSIMADTAGSNIGAFVVDEGAERSGKVIGISRPRRGRPGPGSQRVAG